MATFTTIGTNVLTRLGLMDPGSGASVSDLTYLRTICNEMLQGWSIERVLIYTIAETTFSLTTTVASYTVGAGGTVNIVGAPNHIEQAYIISSDGTRNEIDIVDAARYRKHNDLAATAKTPDEMYPDYDFALGLAKLYFWPVPTFSNATTAAIDYWQALKQFGDLVTDVPLKDGYQDAIESNLAYKACLTAFGESVAQETAALIAQQAQLTKKRISDLNRLNGNLPPEEPAPVAQRQQ